MHLKTVGLAVLWFFGTAAALAQVAILQIRVIEGEGAVYQPGARSVRPITVEITEETGKPVSGAAVSFHLPEDGPGGTFVNGLRTEVVITDARGRASLHGLQANRTPGRFQIRILASKEQARSGTVSFQYVAEPRGGAAAATASAASPGHRKWMAIAAAVAGAGVAGIVASRSGGSPSAPPAAAVVPSPPATVTLSIGTPVITVGKP